MRKSLVERYTDLRRFLATVRETVRITALRCKVATFQAPFSSTVICKYMSYNRLQIYATFASQARTRLSTCHAWDRSLYATQQGVKGFEGRNFEIHPRAYAHETFYFKVFLFSKSVYRTEAQIGVLYVIYRNHTQQNSSDTIKTSFVTFNKLLKV